MDGRGAWRPACCRVVRLLVCVALPLGGAMRRDWGGFFVSFIYLKLGPEVDWRVQGSGFGDGDGASRCLLIGWTPG